MQDILISILLLTDVAILWFLFRGKKQQSPETLTLRDLTEERRFITELKKSIEEDLENVQAQSREVLSKVSKLATEAELEVKTGGGAIAKELEGIVDNLAKRFEAPLATLSSKQGAVEKLIIRLERERQAATKVIQRAEQICAFFNDKIPYQEILEELQDKKYRDARQLLAKGMKADAIAKELGITVSEVEIISGV